MAEPLGEKENGAKKLFSHTEVVTKVKVEGQDKSTARNGAKKVLRQGRS